VFPMVELDFYYILAVIPLVSVINFVPTIEADPNFAQFALSEEAFERGHWWTLFTHLFVHKNVQHVKSNIACIFSSGYPVFQDIGIAGLYGVFLSSGVLAGLNRKGRELQVEAHVEAAIPRAPEKMGDIPVPEQVQDVWNSARQFLTRKTAPVIFRRAEAVGASGAACGLMGYGLTVALERLLLIVRNEYRRTGSATSNLVLSNGGPTRTALEATICILNVAQCGSFLWNEWQLAIGKWSGTDHSGHLTGFGVGALMVIGVRAAQHWLRRPPSSSLREDPQDVRAESRPRRRYISSSGEIRDF